MSLNPKEHFQKTKELATSLSKSDIYDWLVTKGYFPESYVLPPCFTVTKHPTFGTIYFSHKKTKFQPEISEFQQVHFPKTELTDRTFGIIDPKIHSDIAFTISNNWSEVTDCLFHKDNQVCSYSFPIPLNHKTVGGIGELRSGRMIYEFIEMAENDVAAIAFRYKYLIKTDIKNFYPSIYTHSIPWALHEKSIIRQAKNRNDYDFIGNRLDKLLQSANDGCTNGIPIGPVVSDIISEIVLSGVDRELSKSINQDVLVVRFKDDYRILAKSESSGRSVIKALQAALKSYRLELNDGKTTIYRLPSGLFRNWVSEYHSANPQPKAFYDFKRFKEVYLSVIEIDKNNSGCGVIDRFLADIVTKDYKIRLKKLDNRSLVKTISLLLMLAELRTKSFPKILAIIESIIKSPFGLKHIDLIVDHLEEFLVTLKSEEMNNRYLITWIIYFIRANGLESKLKDCSCQFTDPIVYATYNDKFTAFDEHKDFNIFSNVKTIAKRITLLEHLDVFKPQ
jgi:hypothetical protein